jgi:hypothetical protein
MRLLEIANAEEQIELWKLVSNSVWQALQLQKQQQVQQQRQAQTAKANKVKPPRFKRQPTQAAALPHPANLPSPNAPQPSVNKVVATIH